MTSTARPWNEQAARELVEDALLSPSVHNTQPWRFRMREDGIELRADRTRSLRVIDPHQQALEVSCGAALMALGLSCAVRLGRRPEVALLAGGPDPDAIALVRPGSPEEPGVPLQHLHAQLAARHAYRGPFAADETRPDVLAEVRAAAATEGVELVYPDQPRTQAVVDLAREAEFLWARDPAYREEIRRWTGGDVDGVPARACGSQDWTVPRRDFSLAGPRPRPAAASTPGTLTMLLTPGDSTADRIRAGRGLLRAWLVATAHGAAMTLLQQAVERPYLRSLLPGAYASRGAVQAVLTLGTPLPEWAPANTPRRPVADVLDPAGRDVDVRTAAPRTGIPKEGAVSS